MATCHDSVYQAPPSSPPPTSDALRLGPVVFNHLAPTKRHDINTPVSGFPYYSVASFFNVLIRARRGVTITVSNRRNEVGMIYAAYTPGDLWSRLRSGRASLADVPRRVRFPLCHDSETHAPLITQYGLSVLLPKPGCFTIEVSSVGSTKRHRATVRVLVPTC
jgi:hypothetical protein